MHAEVADLLLALELELRRLELWSENPATEAQLNSTEPFCIDTMTFPEWVQFVLISRLKIIIQQGAELPKVSGIAPMAEEYFKGEAINAEAFILSVKKFDQLISRG